MNSKLTLKKIIVIKKVWTDKTVIKYSLGHTQNSIRDVQKSIGIMPESQKVNSTEFLPW